MENLTGKVIESQPDWLTVSAHGEGPAKKMLDLAVGLAAEEEAHGAQRRKWRSMGYEGLSVGRVQYGQRDNHATELRLSGDAANGWFEPAVALADRITRLDLAVTWQGDTPAPRLGLHSLARAKRYHGEHPASAAPWVVSDADGGFTMYLGQRESEYFFRLYNKEAQERKQLGSRYDGRYDRCWRFELETKASIPHRLSKKYLAAENRAEWTQGIVHTYLVNHGLTPPFDSAGGQELVPGFRRKSDETTKLQHLARNVAPTVRWLTERGREDDVRRILGLS